MFARFRSVKGIANMFGVMTLAACLVSFSNPAAAQSHSAFGDPNSGGSGGSGLVAVEASVDGGPVPIGATAQVVVRFRNDGSQPVETGVIRLYPSSNVSAAVTLNQCQDEPLPSSAECAIALSVKGLQSGAWRVEMLMSHSGRARLVSTTMSGSVEAAGEGADQQSNDIEAIPSEVAFETLNKSQTLIEPVVLRNITSNPIDIEDIYIDASRNAGFTLKTECKTLAPGQACIATIAWSPKLRGPTSGVLIVKHTGSAAIISVPIGGEYEPDSVGEAEVFPEAVPGKGLLVASQTEVEFGSGVESSSTITVSLVNAGDAPLTLNDIKIAGTDSGLSLKGDGCAPAMILEPIQACPLTISWSPTRVGSLLDDIHVVHDGARGILVLPVRGESDAAVSQDQGTVLLSSSSVTSRNQTASYDPQKDDGDLTAVQKRAAEKNRKRVTRGPTISNPATVLDGLKITSFSPRRAIIAGPGGSRIVFDDEDIVLGGISWGVNMQRNGIEFTHNDQKVLLLFDRSLSATGNSSSSSSSNTVSSATSSDG